MKKLTLDEIINAIKDNPRMSYKAFKLETKSQGVSDFDFHDAWRRVHPNYHNRRVAQLQEELKKESSKQPKAVLKKIFKDKDYLEEEFDLAYIFHKFKIGTGMFSVKETLMMILILTVFLSVVSRFLLDDMRILGPIGLFVLIYYMDFVLRQAKKYSNEAIHHDFKATALSKKEIEAKHAELIRQGFYIFRETKAKNGRIESLFKTDNGGRETYFGIYNYTVGVKHDKKTISQFIVLQQNKKELPPVHCDNLQHNLYPKNFFGKKIELENDDFNKHYYLAADSNGKDAFRVFNLKVVNRFAEKRTRESLLFFDSKGDKILMGFSPVLWEIHGFPMAHPLVGYNHYCDAKHKIAQHLSISKDIGDALFKQVPNEGIRRNLAKS